MTKISARTGAFRNSRSTPAVCRDCRFTDQNLGECGATRPSAAVAVVPTRRGCCSARHESPSALRDPTRPARCGRRAAASAQPDAAGPLSPRISQRSSRPADRQRSPNRQRVGHESRCRAARPVVRTGLSHRNRSSAAFGTAREAPPCYPSSSSQCVSALAAPTGDDRTPGAGAHPQPKAVHPSPAPVVRLEGPLALGHGTLSSCFWHRVRRAHRRPAVPGAGDALGKSRELLRLTGNRRGLRHSAGRCRIADVRATVRGY